MTGGNGTRGVVSVDAGSDGFEEAYVDVAGKKIRILGKGDDGGGGSSGGGKGYIDV